VISLTLAALETRQGPNIPIANPSRRSARPNRDTNRSNTASVGRSHTAAVHLLEAGVEVNVIRGWLGHADLATTNRYAEINTKTKLAALQAAEPHHVPAGSRTNPIWRSDQSLLNWLASL